MDEWQVENQSLNGWMDRKKQKFKWMNVETKKLKF